MREKRGKGKEREREKKREKEGKREREGKEERERVTHIHSLTQLLPPVHKQGSGTATSCISLASDFSGNTSARYGKGGAELQSPNVDLYMTGKKQLSFYIIESRFNNFN